MYNIFSFVARVFKYSFGIVTLLTGYRFLLSVSWDNLRLLFANFVYWIIFIVLHLAFNELNAMGGKHE